MAIIEDYEDIARRLRELQAASPQRTDKNTELEMWLDLAHETARRYIEDRRRWGRRREDAHNTACVLHPLKKPVVSID